MKIRSLIFSIAIASNTFAQSLDFVKSVFPPDLHLQGVVVHQVEDWKKEVFMMENDSTQKSLNKKFVPMKPGFAESTNNIIDDFNTKCKSLLASNYSRQEYTRVYLNGALSPDYDTTKYKYLLRHKWVMGASHLSQTARVAHETYYLVFYFYDMKNNKIYQHFDLYCSSDYYNAGSFTPLYFFESLYKFIRDLKSKGLEKAYKKRASAINRSCPLMLR